MSLIQSLPSFGPYLHEKETKIAEYKKTVDPATEFKPEVHRPTYRTKEIPAVKVTLS